MTKEKRYYSKEQLNMMRAEVSSSLSFTNLMSQYAEIKPSGKWTQVKCPFHQTDTFDAGRLKENEGRYEGVYFCNHPGCFAYRGKSEGLNLFEFWQEMNSLEHIYDAITDLYSNVLGRELPEPDDDISDEVKERLSQEKRRKLLFKYAAKFYSAALFSEKGKNALAYLKKRGVSEEFAKKYHIGFAPGYKQDIDYFMKKGFTKEELKKEGFVSKKGESSLWGRIMFPLFSIRDNPLNDDFSLGNATVENFYSRQMPEYEKGENAKAFRHRYLNDKLPMYNYGEAKRKQWAIIPEGCFDALGGQAMINQLTHNKVNKDTLGVFGSFGTNGFDAEKNIPLLKRARYKTIFLAGDADGNLAGETSNIEKAELFKEELDASIRIMLLENGDMNDFYLENKDEPEKLVDLMKEAVTLEEYKILVKIKSLGLSSLSTQFELIDSLEDALKDFDIEEENYLKYYKTLQTVAKYLEIDLDIVLFQLLYSKMKDVYQDEAKEKNCSLESLLFQKILEIKQIKEEDLQ